MSRNVEVKAVLRDRDAIISAAARRSDSVPEMISQHDFFFRCRAGRLKLRVYEPDCGELIQYDREDMAGPHCSRYQIAYTSTPEIMLDILTRTLGRIGEVKKTRILFLIGQTRAHIDTVEGLGDFLELEVVLHPEQTEADGRQIAEQLLSEFGIKNDQLIAKAYVDLLASAPTPSGINISQLVELPNVRCHQPFAISRTTCSFPYRLASHRPCPYILDRLTTCRRARGNIDPAE
jgi:predicted adenylyl cyclase CyaB